MDNKQYVLSIIILLGIGMYALPQTVSIYTNQHSWYNISSSEGIPCIKCHGDINSELMNSVGTPHSGMKCKACHMIAKMELGTHSATVPNCIDCHNGNMTAAGVIGAHTFGDQQNCIKCHDGENMKTGLNVTRSLQSVNEPHKNYIYTDGKINNNACIGCHTKVNVNISWNKPTVMSFTVSNMGISDVLPEQYTIVNTSSIWN